MDPDEIMPDPGMTPEEYVDKLILAGVVEVAGLDKETGEFVYGFTDKLTELTEEIKQRMDRMFFEEVQILWQRGFLNMNIMEKNPTITLAQRAMVEEEREALEPRLKETLKYIMNTMRIS